MPKPTEPPEQGAASSDEERFSITVDRHTYEQVEFLAQLWNAIDAARRRKRYRKWGVSNVCPSLIRGAVSGVLAGMGGYPLDPQEQREAIVREIVGVLRSMNPKSSEDREQEAAEIVDEVFREFERMKAAARARESKHRRK